MKIFKDLISGDEMLSDAFELELIDDLYYKVMGKQIKEKTEINDAMFGGNASAEGFVGEDGGDDAGVSGVEMIVRHRLQPTPFDKAQYKIYIKGYVKRVLKKLEEESPDRAEVFAAKIPNFITKVVLKNFKNWEFYTGESQNIEGLVCLLDYCEDGSTAYMLFLKDGLIEEKV